MRYTMDVNYKNPKKYKTAKYPIRQPLFFTWLIWVLSKIMLANKKYKDNIEKINIPSTVIYIGSGAFRKCHFLKSIEIPEGVDTIRDNTFRECTYLESITLPSTLEYIGNYAFSQLQTLTNITIPSDCEVESTAFNYSPNLEIEYK